MKLRGVVAATVLAGVIALIPLVAQSASPALHSVFDGTGLKLLQSAPFHDAPG